MLKHLVKILAASAVEALVSAATRALNRPKATESWKPMKGTLPDPLIGANTALDKLIAQKERKERGMLGHAVQRDYYEWLQERRRKGRSS